ncbi:MAG: Sulfatase [Gemmataceae bacterium]|nr:Sulfatase [Gemmataceae bacterium]
MLDLRTGPASDCSGLSRRSFLGVGGLAAFGLTLPEYLRARAEAPGIAAPKAKRCILLWMQGGPSHHDTFDPKPDAPAEVRGEFATVPTTLPGVRFVEHVPLLAKQTDRLAVIRGHDPKNGSHGVADHLMMSGHPFNPSLPFPCYGSVVAKERGYVNGMLPFVQLGKAIDRRFNGGVGGFLGDEVNPFEVHEDPSAAVFRVRDLSVGADAGRARLDRRYAMLADLENYQKAAEVDSGVMKARDEFYEKAHGIITSPAAKKAFDVAAEPDRVRDRYGRNMLGQQCLLARRLVEAGVQFVTVTDGGWDTHADNFKSLKDRLLPRLDRGLSALLDDLSVRGLLDDTLVVWFGDFGRTPKINPSAGRDHWSTAGCALMAGGGLKTGLVVGRTNALGEYVTDSPVTPQDLAATIYTVLGVNLHTWYRAQDGRPIELCPEGKPIRELL